jgi:hypothetical protein
VKYNFGARNIKDFKIMFFSLSLENNEEGEGEYRVVAWRDFHLTCHDGICFPPLSYIATPFVFSSVVVFHVVFCGFLGMVGG